MHLLQLKYLPFISFKGELSINIDGIQLQTMIAGDYSKKLCKLSLKDFKIIHPKTLNVKITGFGSFNRLTVRNISRIPESWKNKVLYNSHETVQNVMQEVISKFDCKNNNPFA